MSDCMECGLPIRAGEPVVEDGGRPATLTSPAEPPYIAHVECPPACACGDYATHKVGGADVCDGCYDVASIAYGAYRSGVSLSAEYADGGPPYERRER